MSQETGLQASTVGPCPNHEGLEICDRIIEAIGGWDKIESEMRQPTAFEKVIDYRGVRGGAFGLEDFYLHAATRYELGDAWGLESDGLGFRVAAPEPATLSLLALGGLALLRQRK